MRVAIITDDSIPKGLHGFDITVFPWDSEKLDGVNLRDYDGVIVDAETYNSDDKLYSPSDFERNVLTPSIVHDILKTEEPAFFITLGDPSVFVGEDDLLGAIGFSGHYINGSGRSHGLTEQGKKSVYREYLEEIKKYTFAYNLAFEAASETKSAVQDSWLPKLTTLLFPLMQTKSKYFTAFELQVKAYRLDPRGFEDESRYAYSTRPTFLPSHPNGTAHAVDILLRLIRAGGSTTTEKPEWLKQITVYGQERFDTDINKMNQQVEKLIAERVKLEEDRDKLREILEILYLADRPLEKALKSAFAGIGSVIGEPDNNNQVEFYLSDGAFEFVVEVKSSLKAHFNKEGLRQVNEWRENEALDSGKEFKPLLILSNEYNKPIDERAIDVIDENLVAFAVSRDIAVVTVTVLYQVLQLVAGGVLTKDKVIEVLHSNNGLLKLESFHVSKASQDVLPNKPVDDAVRSS